MPWIRDRITEVIRAMTGVPTDSIRGGPRAVILAPSDRDSALLAEMLESAGVVVRNALDMEAFTRELPDYELGLLAQDALSPENLPLLMAALEAQPPWSDISLLLLSEATDPAAGASIARALGNVTVIQHPVDSPSLLTAVRSAVRVRGKQYQMRDLLEAQEAQRAQNQALNEQLSLAIDAARMGTWRLDMETGVLDCSERCKANFGLLTEAPFRYEDLVAMIVPEDRGRMQAAVQRAISTHSVYEAEYRILWPDGSLHWIFASGRPQYDACDRPVAMSGVTLKVTDRKRDEEALRESKESLALAVDGAQLGTFYCEMPLDRLVWNERCKEHFFVSPDAEVDLALFYARLHPDDREPTRQAIERAMAERVPYNVEYRTLAPDGRMRWINASGRFYYGDTGEPKRFDGITIDVTEKKTRERALKLLLEIDDATREMQEPLSIMAAVTRLLGEFLGASRCAYAPVEEDGDHFNIYGDYTDGCRSIVGRYPLTSFGSKAFGDLSQGKTYVIMDIDREIPPGEDLAAYRLTEIQAVVCTSLIKNNRMAALMAVHQTVPRLWTPEEVELVELVSERSWAIIERAQADKRLQERAREIEALNLRLRRAMAETHHRVKNNLQVMSAMVEMQMSEYGMQSTVFLEKYRQLQAHIQTLSIVHDLLSASAKEEDVQRVSTKAVLDKLLPMLQQTAWDKEVTYSVDDAKLTSKLCVSLSLVLNELVTNAFKHGRRCADVAFRVEGTHATLTVSDDGPGFPDGFEPLQAAHMGLELVESLVGADLNGRSTYSNRPEGGGSVHITFALPPEDD